MANAPPGPTSGSTTPDVVWIIDTLDHLREPDQQLRPLLTDARVVISEHLTVNRAHGQQHFHHRRTPGQITQIFSPTASRKQKTR